MKPDHPVIRCCQVTRKFREGRLEVDVLKGVDIKVVGAEKVAILGSSGSGKSTLLHIMGGLDLPTSGQVLIQGNDMADLSEADRGKMRNEKIGFIYQFHHLLPEFTAVENVAMPLLIGDAAVPEARQRAETMLQKVGLEHRLNHKPGQLSGGERQRAAIARALVTRPLAVLADEPTGNLDHQTAERVFALMQELNDELDTAFVVVTHDMTLASRMDTIYRIQDGLLINE